MNNNELNKQKLKFDKIFYNKISPILNKISGLNPRDRFSIGLFLNLGVEFEWIMDESIEEMQSLRTVDEKVKELLKRLTAFVRMMDNEFSKENAVVIKIKIKNKEEIPAVFELLMDQDIYGFLSFVYLHEVQHILRKHNTSSFNSLMKNIVLKQKSREFVETIGDYGLHQLFNIAEDYAINYSIIEILDSAKENEIHAISNSIKSAGVLYKPGHEGMSELDILKQILDDDEITNNLNLGNQVGENGRLGSSIEDIKDIIEAGLGKDKGDKSKNVGTSFSDKQIDSLSEALQKTIDKQAGKEGFLLDKVIKNSIKVDVRWFDKLQQGLYNYINKKTKHSVANWSNLDNKLRHIYKAPNRKNIEKTVDLIVSVDQSGSISYESLGKLLYLFEQKSKNINELTFLFHDTDIAHVETFSGKFDSKRIISACKKRYCGGGTSHKKVFEWLDDNLSQRDVSRKIYVSFSDNYSDIEDVYFSHKTIKKISKIWLNSEGRDVGKNIAGVKVNFT